VQLERFKTPRAKKIKTPNAPSTLFESQVISKGLQIDKMVYI